MQPLPHSRARNAYELMQDVNDAILAEPARLYMGSWVLAFKDTSLAKRSVKLVNMPHAPSCGTIGCYAGWTTFLAKGERLESCDIEDQALQLLVGDPVDSYSLSRNFTLRVDLISAFSHTNVTETIMSGKTTGRKLKLRPGTRRYARAVVKRFEAVMATHETYLRALELDR